MMKRSTKYTIKKGKLVLNKPAKPKAKLTDYERYVNIARSNGLPKSEILNKLHNICDSPYNNSPAASLASAISGVISEYSITFGMYFSLVIGSR